MCNQPLHHMVEYFAESHNFRPERWLREAGNEPLRCSHSFVYMPFGFGPRMCIGKRTAEMEVQLLVARVLRSYRLEWHHPPMAFVDGVVIVPGSPLRLRMIPL